jgi:hypothetical protein
MHFGLLWVTLGYFGLWVMGYGLWVMGYGLWVRVNGVSSRIVTLFQGAKLSPWQDPYESNLLGAGCWVLGAGCWVLGAGCWVLGASKVRSFPHGKTPTNRICWVLGTTGSGLAFCLSHTEQWGHTTQHRGQRGIGVRPYI